MHVLADTWAHQGFVGSPNKNINNIDIIAGDERGYLRFYDIGREYSGIYLGHAMMGHMPDVSHLQYSYQPAWLNGIIEVNNQDRFYNAFCQMVDVLAHIKNESGSMELLESYAQNDILSANLRGMLAGMFATQSDGEHEACQHWLTTMQDIWPAPVAYSSQAPDEALREFARMAAVHAQSVMDYINSKIPGYFKP